MAAFVASVEPPLARLRIDNAGRLNAVDRAMWRDLPRLCEEFAARGDLDAVILEGAGGQFCAGADIGEFEAIFADAGATRAYLDDIRRALEALNRLELPTIARLEGVVFGAGLALALACDLRFSAQDARFCAPPAKLGWVYGPLETRWLVQAVGASAAKRMLFGALVLDAGEALRCGLVDEVAPAADLEALVQTETRRWSRLSPASIAGAKSIVAAVLDGDDAAARAVVETVAAGPDFEEGRAAFREKRQAAFPRRPPR